MCVRGEKALLLFNFGKEEGGDAKAEVSLNV